MSESKYSICWNSYKNNICNGFAEMQQRQEFVDMTLVAEGHLVKVHKNLISLASPFMKEIILTVPCEHPIIFLNNVSHDILCYLLEYIYTGEVNVEVDKLQTLLKVANDLQLYGLQKAALQKVLFNRLQKKEEVLNSTSVPAKAKIIIADIYLILGVLVKVPTKSIFTKEFIKDNTEKPVCISQTINVNPGSVTDFTTPENSYWQSISKDNADNDALCPNEQHEKTVDQNNDYMNKNDSDTVTDLNDVTYIVNDIINNDPQGVGDEPSSNIKAITIDPTGSLPQQYSVSNRGSLQLIFNRFIYYMHHQALCGRKRRWRCINYRRNHCPAYVDTMDETIIFRKNAHAHQYHDDKIIKKIRLNQVYGSLQTTIHGADTIKKLSEKRRKLNDNN